MAPWQLMFGVGIGLIVTIIATMISQRPQRALTSSKPKTSFVEPPDVVCPICLSVMPNDERSYLNCGHALHQQCLKKLRIYSDKCPTCRFKI